MNEEDNFYKIRRNFIICSYICLVLALAQPDFSKLQILGMPSHLSSENFWLIFIATWVYFLWRFWQKSNEFTHESSQKAMEEQKTSLISPKIIKSLEIRFPVQDPYTISKRHVAITKEVLNGEKWHIHYTCSDPHCILSETSRIIDEMNKYTTIAKGGGSNQPPPALVGPEKAHFTAL